MSYKVRRSSCAREPSTPSSVRAITVTSPTGKALALSDHATGDRRLSSQAQIETSDRRLHDAFRVDLTTGAPEGGRYPQYYRVAMNRLMASILLGILTYDANLLVITPKKLPKREVDEKHIILP